ncbi:MAG: 50S ribosomal protein L3 [Alphaproteobacteria bacterium]
MPVSLLGKKIGMSQTYLDDGRVVPVTVIQAGPCRVVQVKTRERDGYEAVQVGFGVRKRQRTTKPLIGHYHKAKCEPAEWLRELPMPEGDAPEPGQTLTVAAFEGVPMVDVTGTTKGRGFAGVVKRWGFAGGPATHGCSKRHRAPGSIGMAASPDRAVLKGKKMAGHMGCRNRTVRHLEVVAIDTERSLLLVKGAVPGPNGGHVIIRESKTAKRKGE